MANKIWVVEEKEDKASKWRPYTAMVFEDEDRANRACEKMIYYAGEYHVRCYVPRDTVIPCARCQMTLDEMADKTAANPRGMSTQWNWWLPDNHLGAPPVRFGQKYQRVETGMQLWVETVYSTQWANWVVLLTVDRAQIHMLAAEFLLFWRVA